MDDYIFIGRLLLEVLSDDNKGEGIEIQSQDLKGVFFVKDFVGNPSYDEQKHFLEGQQATVRMVKNNV